MTITPITARTRRCPVCGEWFPAAGRGRYRSQACRQQAYRLRQESLIRAAPEASIPLPERVTIALGELRETARGGLLALSVGLGLAVVGEIFEEEIALVVGPRGKHDPERQAYRHGRERRQLTLGGRRVEVAKPRARSKACEDVELDSYRFFASGDLLTEAALVRMLAGLSTRRYRAGLEPIGKLERGGYCPTTGRLRGEHHAPGPERLSSPARGRGCWRRRHPRS